MLSSHGSQQKREAMLPLAAARISDAIDGENCDNEEDRWGEEAVLVYDAASSSEGEPEESEQAKKNNNTVEHDGFAGVRDRAVPFSAVETGHDKTAVEDLPSMSRPDRVEIPIGMPTFMSEVSTTAAVPQPTPILEPVAGSSSKATSSKSKPLRSTTTNKPTNKKTKTAQRAVAEEMPDYDEWDLKKLTVRYFLLFYS